jgi:anti-sigma factor RsiW
MNEINGCERESDLIAFLYDEANEHERRDFQLHLQECSNCREEVGAFGVVRESITVWRDEALSGFVSAPVATKRKSAVAALRQFFELSPLWLKGATAVGAAAFCLLAGFAIVRFQTPDRVTSNEVNPSPGYTQQDVDRIVKEALANQKLTEQPVETVAQAPTKSPRPKKSKAAPATEFVKSRRPLSRAEREQLAVDLRLLSNGDDGLNLLGDRINQ